jgi:protein-S-isoprenylcysteine O-methyltransferase Ste14
MAGELKAIYTIVGAMAALFSVIFIWLLSRNIRSVYPVYMGFLTVGALLAAQILDIIIKRKKRAAKRARDAARRTESETAGDADERENAYG